MLDIKIFPTHRIDVKSELIDNPLFYPVRCGAVFDGDAHPAIQGDDTGDHISEKRMSYCEFTVHYWAWKNIDADYYGFCHYRRYLSFSSRQYKENMYGCVEYPRIDDAAIERFQITEEAMRKTIEAHDIITCKPVDVKKTGNYASVYDYCKKLPHAYNIGDVDLLIDLIKEKYPGYSQTVDEYFAGGKNYWYNCYIMTKELYREYCTWLFDILFAYEKRLDTRYYSQEKTRMAGVMGERLFGIFYTHLQKRNKYRACELQLVYFQNTDSSLPLVPAFDRDNIPIAFGLTSQYLPYSSAAIHSLMLHAGDGHNYDVVVLHSEISGYYQEILQRMAGGRDNIRLRFYNTSSRLRAYQRINGKRINEANHFPYAVPDVFRRYDRVLYVHGDVIFRQDPAALARCDMEGKMVAAALDMDQIAGYNMKGVLPKKDWLAFDRLKLENPYEYYQDGIVLYDVREFNREFSPDDFVREPVSGGERTAYRELLNKKCQGRIKRLDMRWNVLADSNTERRDRIGYHAPLYLSEEYKAARQDPYIIHFSGHTKPWQNPGVDFGDQFSVYMRQSPFYEFWMIQIAKAALKPPRQGLKKRIKRNIHIIANGLLPKDTKRRLLVKRIYQKIKR